MVRSALAPIGCAAMIGCAGSAGGERTSAVVDPSSDAAIDATYGPIMMSDGATSSPAGSSCTGKSGTSGDHPFSLTSAGLLRTGVLHVPASYDPTKPTTLVLHFHGFAMDGVGEELLTGMNETSDAHGFIVVYPDGIASSWNAGDCCGDAWVNAVDDVQFTRDLIASITSSYCVDDARIFATGFSNGGFLAHRLGCELADRIAAIAPVAGVLGIDPATCKPSRAVPVFDVHGTGDLIVPYDGGIPIAGIDFGGFVDFRSVDTTIDSWRAIDACVGVPQITYLHGDATCRTWARCNDGADVTLCTITNGGHSWPDGQPGVFDGISGGFVSTDLDANEEIYAFFAAHPFKN